MKRKSKVPRQRKHAPQKRLWVVSAMSTLALTGLLLRLGYVEVSNGAMFRSQATNVQVASYPVLPPRGFIYSSNDSVLAEDRPVFDAYLTRLPNTSVQLPQMAARLAPWLHMSSAAVLAAMQTSPESPEVVLAKNLSEAAISFIYEHQSELPGVRVQEDPVRYYPYGDLAAHILGYVGPITSANQNYYVNHLGYLESQIVGETGVEAQYEHYLRGTVGYQQDLISANGAPDRSIGMDPPAQSGDNLQLTINSAYQAYAQQIVANFVNTSEMKSEITEASAVVLDVKTGAVLALVSYPYYNPNWFINGDFLKHASYLEKSDALIDNVIQSPEYPGSAVKPANAIAAMESGTITPQTIVDDHGYLQIGNRIFHNWYLPGFGPINVEQAIEHSDDTFFYQVGLWLGGWTNNHYPNGESYGQWVKTRFVKAMDTIFGWEYKFGMGAMTGIDLPGEVPGTFYEENTQNNYQEVVYHLHQAEQSMAKKGYYDNWGALPDLAFADIGQSQQFTPIEMAQYVMTMADRGVKLEPHVLQAVYPADAAPNTKGAKPIYVFQPKVEARLNINPVYLNASLQGMYLMANAPGGLLYQGGFANSPYHAAGKTGTAQIEMNGRRIDNSVTIAFAPFHHPQIAIAVMVPGGGASTTTASHIAHRLFNAYFKMHHEFFPKSQWLPDTVPANWANSFAAEQPSKGTMP